MSGSAGSIKSDVDLLAELQDGQPRGAITPQYIRDIVVSKTSQLQAALPSSVVKASGGDDTAAIQSSIDQKTTNGGIVQLTGGTYNVAGITIKPNVILDLGGSTIKLANAANSDAIQGAGFTTLTGGGTGGGVSNFSIRNGIIDGNRANQTTAGFGIRVYGYNFTLSNLIIKNAFSDGMWTEWGGLGAGNPADSMEAKFENIKIHDCGGWGWHNRGPHDSTASSIIIFNNNQAGGSCGGLWCEDDSASGNYLAGAFQLNNSHVWGSHKWSIINDSALYCSNCQAEGAIYGQILNRGTLMFFGGKIFYLSPTASSTGSGIQMGDNGSTPGVPSSFSYFSSYSIIHTSFQYFWGLSGGSAPINWVHANRCDIRSQAHLPTATVAAGSNGQAITALTGGQLSLASTSGMPVSGSAYVQTSGGYAQISWTGITSGNLTGVTVGSGSGTVSTGGVLTGDVFGFTAPDPSTSAIDFTASFLGGPTGMPGAASQHYLKGNLAVETGSRPTAVTFTANGNDYVNLNTASKRMEFVNGLTLRGYSDGYATKTFDLDGAKGHLSFNPATAPTISAGGNAGTSPPAPTLQSISSDVCGQALWGTGTAPAVGAQVFVSFGLTWINNPVIVLTPANAATASLQPYITGLSPTGFNIAVNVAPSASMAAGTYAVNWIALGRNS